MRVTDLRDALLDVTEKVYHYRAPARDCGSRYICWGETNGSVALSADDTPESLTITGEIILYTQTEYDTTVNTLMTALTGMTEQDVFAWQIAGMGYDETGHYFQYVFSWSMSCAVGGIY